MEGATLGSSPAAVVNATDITLAMLSDPRACIEVALALKESSRDSLQVKATLTFPLLMQLLSLYK